MDMFFSSWESIGRTALLGLIAYAALVVMLRVSGKRTLGQMNIFDFAVSVAFGSILATTMLSRSISLLDGVVAFAALIVGQFVVAWASVRWPFARKLVRAEAALLLYRGQFQRETMQRERMTEGEVRAAARAEGILDLADVEAIILETNGSISVVPGDTGPVGASSLEGIAPRSDADSR